MKKQYFFLSLFLLLIAIKGGAQILTESNLPIIVIETEDDIPDEPKINGTIGIIYNGEGEINTVGESFDYYASNIGIETRGNSTQGFDKKTYSMELRDENNEDYSANLFDMGGEEDWILHAMVIDKSQLRIPMSFYLSQRMGHYASEWRYVELIVNEEYQGLYILTERIKRDDDRVDIAKLDSDDIAGDSLTGGYILRIDWLDDFDNSSGFESDYEAQGGDPMTFQWYYPKAENIEPEQAAYIQNWMRDFEDALFDSDYTNEQGLRYTDYIDVNSFTDFLLINEFSKNSDGYKLSSYVHKDKDSKGGKLTAGPIWDFDQTYGVSEVCSCDDFTGWTYLQNQDDCEDLESMPLWWQTMMQDPVFQNRLKCRWTEFRSEFLHTDSVHAWIDTYTDLLAPAIDRNFTQWDDFIGEAIWFEPEPIPQSYAEEIQVLKDWTAQRLTWIDNNLPGSCADDTLNGLNELKENSKLLISPNPSTGLLTIRSDYMESVAYRIYSTKGQKLREGYLQPGNNLEDLSDLPHGVYYLKTEQEVQKLCLVK